MNDQDSKAAQVMHCDLLYGVPAIAEFLGIPERATYHRVATGQLPSFKIGKSSLGLHYQFFVDEALCVDTRMTVVCVELAGLQNRPIPAAYRLKFEEILEEA